MIIPDNLKKYIKVTERANTGPIDGKSVGYTREG